MVNIYSRPDSDTKKKSFFYASPAVAENLKATDEHTVGLKHEENH